MHKRVVHAHPPHTGSLGSFGDANVLYYGVSWRARKLVTHQFLCLHLPPPARRIPLFLPKTFTASRESQPAILCLRQGCPLQGCPPQGCPLPGLRARSHPRSSRSSTVRETHPAPGSQTPAPLSQAPGATAQRGVTSRNWHLEHSWEDSDLFTSGAWGPASQHRARNWRGPRSSKDC